MTPRERFKAVMNFGSFDRLPYMEWASWWDKTIDRWVGEGLPSHLHPVGSGNRKNLDDFFGLDIFHQYWMTSVHWECPVYEGHGAGILRTEADYEKLRPYFFRIMEDFPLDVERWRQWAREQQAGNAALWITLPGFFWQPRVLLGIEHHLLAFYDQPHLMHRINEDLTQWMLEVLERICDVAIPDFMTFAEDMSYNNGPMLSREQFDEFMLPYYRRIVPALKERGILVMVDSDGDLTLGTEWFLDAGIDGLLPMERQSGIDIVELRTRFPQLRMIGGFDKLTMHQGEDAMRREFERLLPLARQGGYIISVDHQTPPGVSLEQYRCYLRLLKEYSHAAGAH